MHVSHICDSFLRLWTPWIDCGRHENAHMVHMRGQWECGFGLFVDNVDNKV